MSTQLKNTVKIPKILVIIGFIVIAIGSIWMHEVGQNSDIYTNAFGVYQGSCPGCWLGGISQFDRIPGAVPIAFQKLSEYYYKDVFSVFSPFPEWKIISHDTIHFEIINWRYAKDSQKVYWDGYPVEGADSKTFHEIYSGIYEDKDRFYFAGRAISFMDDSLSHYVSIEKENIEYLSNKINIPTCHANYNLCYYLFRDRTSGDIYALTVGDANGTGTYSPPPNARLLPIKQIKQLAPYSQWTTNIPEGSARNYDYPIFLGNDGTYSYVFTVEGLNSERIKPDSNFISYCTGYYSVYGNVYYFQKYLPDADSKTFKCKDIQSQVANHFNSSYAIDYKNVYLHGDVIQGADINSFVFLAPTVRDFSLDLSGNKKYGSV